MTTGSDLEQPTFLKRILVLAEGHRNNDGTLREATRRRRTNPLNSSTNTHPSNCVSRYSLFYRDSESNIQQLKRK